MAKEKDFEELRRTVAQYNQAIETLVDYFNSRLEEERAQIPTNVDPGSLTIDPRPVEEFLLATNKIRLPPL